MKQDIERRFIRLRVMLSEIDNLDGEDLDRRRREIEWLIGDLRARLPRTEGGNV
jgi:hypothetical protein